MTRGFVNSAWGDCAGDIVLHAAAADACAYEETPKRGESKPASARNSPPSSSVSEAETNKKSAHPVSQWQTRMGFAVSTESTSL